MHFRSGHENKVRLRFILPSVYAKADDISIETVRRAVRPFSLFVQTNSPDVLNQRRQSSRCPGRGFAGEVRPIILTFFDIFKHLKGVGNGNGHLGRGWPPQLPAKVAIHGQGEYKSPREPLPVFLIILPHLDTHKQITKTHIYRLIQIFT